MEPAGRLASTYDSGRVLKCSEAFFPKPHVAAFAPSKQLLVKRPAVSNVSLPREHQVPAVCAQSYGDSGMTFHITRTIQLPFEQAVTATKEALKKHGFGVLTEIDVRDTLKHKLDVDFRPYRILGACNPQMAHKALQFEDKIGTMLPCNVVVQQLDGKVEISAIDPVASMQAVENPELSKVAGQVRSLLQKAVDDAGS